VVVVSGLFTFNKSSMIMESFAKMKVEPYDAKDQEVIVSPEELEKLQREEEELKQQNTEFDLE